MSAPLNAIELEVIYQSTLQIARELTVNMQRTGYSTVIKESQDFTFAIFDGDARLVAQGIPQPAHIGPISAQVCEVHRAFEGNLDPGDAIIVNHPYRACQNHATDVTLIAPIFVEGRLVAFIGNTAHKTDFGGKVPGTNSPDATEVFQEGLLLPPVKLMREGVLNQELYEVICANTRTPEMTWGDVNAQMQTNTYGVQKFIELFEKYGVDRVLSCWDRWMDICERELRSEILKLPDGVYGPETDYLDDDGIDRDTPVRISLSVEVTGDTLNFTIDSDPQTRGPLNLRPCVTKTFTECWVKMAFGPDLPFNEGISRPVNINYPPEGALVNPRFPAPVNMYVRASQLISTLVARVLGLVQPERIPAPSSGASGSVVMSGHNPRTERWFSFQDIYNGGGGARPHEDGVSVQDDLVLNVLNTPVEAMETEFPVEIASYQLVPDSGGAGKYRGGLGARRQWRFVGEEAVFNLRTDRFKFSSPGSQGALPAKPSSACMNPGAANEEAIASKVSARQLKNGDVISWALGGGGGWGDPLQRDPEAVRQDVVCGYVSLGSAARDYGVVLREAGFEIDWERTEACRVERARQ